MVRETFPGSAKRAEWKQLVNDYEADPNLPRISLWEMRSRANKPALTATLDRMIDHASQAVAHENEANKLQQRLATAFGCDVSDLSSLIRDPVAVAEASRNLGFEATDSDGGRSSSGPDLGSGPNTLA